jgi:hypothetical protein
MRSILGKFGGRRFCLAVSVALLVGVNDALELGMARESLEIMAALAASFIFGESIIDASSALLVRPGSRLEPEPEPAPAKKKGTK